MNPQLLEKSLDYMEREIGKGGKYSPLQRQKIKVEIINESDKALEGAFDYIILNFVGLPTPQKLIDAVRHEASKRRGNEWSREKKELSRALQPVTQFAKECMGIALKFYPGEDAKGFKIPVDYKTIIEDAQTMACKYPASGWADISQEWREWWGRKGKG